jgi:hypothetical protein
MEGGNVARLPAMLLAFPIGKRPLLLIHRDVMYTGFAGAKTCHAPYLLSCRQKKTQTYC